MAFIVFLLSRYLPNFVLPEAELLGEAQNRGASRASLYAPILDNCTVSVKLRLLQRFRVPGIAHYEATRKKIIRLLREERERQGLSKYVVAQRSGVSESMVGLVERGLRNPSVELILRMADGVGADLPNIIKKAIATVGNPQRKKPLRENS